MAQDKGMIVLMLTSEGHPDQKAIGARRCLGDEH